MKSLRIGKFEIAMPASRAVRILLGLVLIVGGILGFLPVLGFWMIPLGFAVLSIDFLIVRRARRRIMVWIGRKLNRHLPDRWSNKP